MGTSWFFDSNFHSQVCYPKKSCCLPGNFTMAPCQKKMCFLFRQRRISSNYTYIYIYISFSDSLNLLSWMDWIEQFDPSTGEPYFLLSIMNRNNILQFSTPKKLEVYLVIFGYFPGLSRVDFCFPTSASNSEGRDPIDDQPAIVRKENHHRLKSADWLLGEYGDGNPKKFYVTNPRWFVWCCFFVGWFFHEILVSAQTWKPRSGSWK